MSLNQYEPSSKARRKSSVLVAKACSRAKYTISEDRKVEMALTFAQLDKNNSGYIEPESLLDAVRIFGFDITSAASDRSKEGKIGRNEYMSFMLSYAQSQDGWCYREMRDLFKCFDREGCGYITDAQVRRIFQRYGERMTAAEIESELGQYFIRENHHIEFDSFMMLLAEAP